MYYIFPKRYIVIGTNYHFPTHCRPKRKTLSYRYYDSAKAHDYPKIIFFVDEHNPHKVCYKGRHVHETRTSTKTSCNFN